MRILVVGAGLTGCTLARLMKDKGYSVSILEKEDHIGGLCYTTRSPKGTFYEPFGAHAFHTNDSRVKDFVIKFSDFNKIIAILCEVLSGNGSSNINMPVYFDSIINPVLPPKKSWLAGKIFLLCKSLKYTVPKSSIVSPLVISKRGGLVLKIYWLK